MNRQRSKSTFIIEIFIILFIIFALFPVIYIVSISFGKTTGMYTSSVLPRSFTFDNYRALFTKTKYLTWLKNSLKISGISMVLSVIIAAMAAYAFSRLDFYGSSTLLKAFVVLQIFPATMSMVAIFRILQIFNLINKAAGLIVVYVSITVPFSILIIKGYFDSIPRDIEEAAFIDGANRAQIFIKITLPLAQPIIAVTAINNFIATFSEYALSSIIITGTDNYTVAVGLRTFLEGDFGTNWPIFAAAAILTSIPTLILFFYVQDFFVSSMTSGYGKL